MARYKADNGKVVDTAKMDLILELDYEGSYGNVDSGLYRTRKSHTWYQVCESSWGGEGNISGADEVALKDVAALIMEHDPDSLVDYPELAPYQAEVIDE